jgi:hypothetical protein
MTTPDIAGLCEKLRETRSVWSEAKEASIKRRRNPDGPQAADTIERQAAEIERLRAAQKVLRTSEWEFTGNERASKAFAALTGEDA